jgi:hypothetical protein
LAAQATPEELAVTQRQNMEPRTIEPALQLLVENPTAAVEMQVDAAEEEPEAVERVVSAPLRAHQAGLSLSATTPRTARPELMPTVSNATTKPAKISSPPLPSGPAAAGAGFAAAFGIDPRQPVAIELADAKKTGTTAAASVPPGIPRNMQGIYLQLNPPADDSWSPRSAPRRR